MTSLLIYNNNLPDVLVELFSNKLNLTTPKSKAIQDTFNIDLHFHEQIEQTLKDKYDIIFITYNLSEENYLELAGLRVGLHIRLTKLWKHYLCPIVFIGSESIYEINKLSVYGNLLFTPGIYSITQDLVTTTFSDITKERNNLITPIQYEIFLQRIIIHPPTNYASHHSMANEWSIVRWAELLKINDTEIDNTKKNLQASLFYKYLSVKQGKLMSELPAEVNLTNKGKILYIDDEIAKGWGNIFNKIVPTGLRSIGQNFKFIDAEEIISKSISEVASYNPDVVILDLRLTDSDFGPLQSPQNLTGYKLLEKIKDHNRGIQVIIFSATNKIWNLLALQDKGANGFIIKEDPFMDTDANLTLESLKNVYKEIKVGLKMSFLKAIYEKILHVHSILIKQYTLSDKKDFANRALINLEISFSLFDNIRKNEKYSNYGYLQLFQIIEDFSNIKDVFEYNGNSCLVRCFGNTVEILRITDNNTKPWTCDTCITISQKNKVYSLKKESAYRQTLDTYFKVSSLLIFRYGFSTNNNIGWPAINKIRNEIAHGDTGTIVSNLHIAQCLDFIIYILQDENQKNNNISNGLSTTTSVEKLTALKNKFNSKK